MILSDIVVQPDEDGPKTSNHLIVGSEGVCGLLADGYHYPNRQLGAIRSL